jgi:hypothetical protein
VWGAAPRNHGSAGRLRTPFSLAACSESDFVPQTRTCSSQPQQVGYWHFTFHDQWNGSRIPCLEISFFLPAAPLIIKDPPRRCGAEETDTATIQNCNCRRHSRLPCSLVPGTSCRWGAVPAQSETLTNAELCVDLLLHPSSNGSARDGAHLIRAHRAAPSLAPYQGPSSPDLTVTRREISGAGSYLVMLPRCPTYF